MKSLNDWMCFIAIICSNPRCDTRLLVCMDRFRTFCLKVIDGIFLRGTDRIERMGRDRLDSSKSKVNR